MMPPVPKPEPRHELYQLLLSEMRPHVHVMKELDQGYLKKIMHIILDEKNEEDEEDEEKYFKLSIEIKRVLRLYKLVCREHKLIHNLPKAEIVNNLSFYGLAKYLLSDLMLLNRDNRAELKKIVDGVGHIFVRLCEFSDKNLSKHLRTKLLLTEDIDANVPKNSIVVVENMVEIAVTDAEKHKHPVLKPKVQTPPADWMTTAYKILDFFLSGGIDLNVASSEEH